MVSRETLQALEFPRLLLVLAELAVTDLGREWVLGLAPQAVSEAVAVSRRRLEETIALVAEGSLVQAPEVPFSPLLKRLDGGGEALGPRELVQLGELLHTTRRAEQRLLEDPERCPTLADLRAEIGLGVDDAGRIDELAGRISRTLDGRGEIRDDASPRLEALRRAVQSRRQSLYQHIAGYIESHRESLGEDTASFREGRLTVLLPVGERGRLPGLIHARSATGKSYYFEPLEMVEPNNELQQATAEEAAERRRILEELQRQAHAAEDAIAGYGELLRVLDGLQALATYSRLVDCAEPEAGANDELALKGARHPLLEPRLADLRELALGSAGHRGSVVPLDLDFGGLRALVLTGPNAGGKTVALKTVGLAILAYQAGLPVPCDLGTRLPVVSSLVAVVGDEQDLLADRSTFSARLLRFKQAWDEAGPESLTLLDEMGSGTNPQEGAALAISFLEGLLEQGGLTLMTTHLTELAARALELEAAGCLAMEIDPVSLGPTFRLRSGPPAASEALALARRLGLPAVWLDRAEAILGPEHRQLTRLLQDTERLRQELEGKVDELDRELVRKKAATAELDAARGRLEVERKGLKARYKDALLELRRSVEGRLGGELQRLAEEAAVDRQPLGDRRKRTLAREGAEHLLEALPELLAETSTEEPEGRDGPIEVGSWVCHRALGWQGKVERLQPNRVEVLVKGKRLHCSLDELSPVATPSRQARPGAVRAPEPAPVAAELNLIGQRVASALDAVDRYLDRALLTSARTVRVVHGHGSGRLRTAVRDHLRHHPAVREVAPAPPSEGGNGATIVVLRSMEN